MLNCKYCKSDEVEVSEYAEVALGYIFYRTHCKNCDALGPPSLTEKGARDWHMEGDDK